MKTILPNIWMLLVRVILLVFFIYICQWPLEKIGRKDYLDHPVVFWIGFAVTMMLPAYLIWTLLGVMWITLSDDETGIRLHYLFKTITIIGADIDGYYKTVLETKVYRFKGLLIKLKSGKTIEVTNYNLQSISRINIFLRQNRVPLKGDIQSLFPLTRKI